MDEIDGKGREWEPQNNQTHIQQNMEIVNFKGS